MLADTAHWPHRKPARGENGDTASRVGLTVYIPMGVCFMEYDGRIVNLSDETPPS
jgi:hypothetical protein